MNRELSLQCNNIVQLMQLRQTKNSVNHSIQRQLHVTEDFVNRLGLEKELEGHNGCVNCLEWNESGKILASASDDVQVILWDPFLHKEMHTVQTGHHGNIFSVKFLPKSSDSVIVTGAGDCRIRVHDILLGESTQVQFDLRTPHTCSREVNVLINLLNHMGRYAEAKCLSINPVRPELLAVGANDPYIRLYDRRMIKPTNFQYPPAQGGWDRQGMPFDNEHEDNLPTSCVQYFVAGHLPLKQHDFRKRYRNLASTYLTFSSDGNELLVNLGGEQIYLFDINNKRMPKTFDVKGVNTNDFKPYKEHCPASNGYSNGYRTANGFSTSSNGVTRSNNAISAFFQTASSNSDTNKMKALPKKVEALKLRANDEFEKQHYTLAISMYNRAISMCPSHAILYGNRAAAYMKRSWDGDVYAAMRDCHTALLLDPDHIKAHFRLARCLLELQWTEEAWECLQVFKAKFPDHAHSHACKALAKDIQTASSAAAAAAASAAASAAAAAAAKPDAAAHIGTVEMQTSARQH
ncbi:Protein will die slowly, partial [Gryllus bimaculatus]